MSGQPQAAPALRVISSMATAALLEALLGEYRRHGDRTAELLSVGGVDAQRRVADGETFDVVVLASEAIERLSAAQCLLPGSRVDLVRSSVAVAVPAGASHPDIGSEQSLRAAVLAAGGIGYSSGPSGEGLMALLQRWGIRDQLGSRLVQARPGVPVASLLARGQVTLGFQQYSELQGQPGIELLGQLPATCAIETIFSGAICARSPQPTPARALLAYLGAAEASALKRQHGMMAA